MPVGSATQAQHLSYPPTRFVKIAREVGALALRVGEMIRLFFEKICPCLFARRDLFSHGSKELRAHSVTSSSTTGSSSSLPAVGEGDSSNGTLGSDAANTLMAIARLRAQSGSPHSLDRDDSKSLIHEERSDPSGTCQIHIEAVSPPLSPVNGNGPSGLTMPRASSSKSSSPSLVLRKKEGERREFNLFRVEGSKGLNVDETSAGIYCALQAIQSFWPLIQTQNPKIETGQLNQILEQGIALWVKQDGIDPFTHFPRIKEQPFCEQIPKVQKYPTLLKEDDAIYGITYSRRILEELEQIYAVAGRNDEDLAAGIFLKGHKDAQEAFAIFFHRPEDEADRYFLLDFGAFKGAPVTLQQFDLRAHLRDFLIQRAPVSFSEDQQNDLYKFLALKVV